MKYCGKNVAIIDRISRDIGDCVTSIMEREGVEAKDLAGYAFSTRNGLVMTLRENSVHKEQRLAKKGRKKA